MSNVSQHLGTLADGLGMPKTGIAAAAMGGSRGGDVDRGVNNQLLQVIRSGATGSIGSAQVLLKGAGGEAANVDLKKEVNGTVKHRRTTHHSFAMTCQQPPVTIKWYPQSCFGTIEHVELLLDVRGEPTPDKHQARFELSPDTDSEHEVPPHLARPGNSLHIGVHMYSESGTGYDVVQYEMEILTGTWDSGGKPLDNCGRWSNENGHTFVGIWRNGKPHTGKGAWSELMRGRGQAAMAVMQGEWRAGLGSGVLTSGPDAWRVALDQSKVSAERKPWEVERDVGDEVRHRDNTTSRDLWHHHTASIQFY